MLGILTLEVSKGTEIKITAVGEDEEKAISKIKNLIEGDFE
ncbi:MAG: HPr family phosphocarrier protein [Deltaproteobacteria bacterium]|nr:HPr family phosphocarrier protein [Deltaproteobacteria bacterium]